MKKVFLYALMVLALLGVVACAQPVSGEVIRSEKQRETSPNVNETDLTTLVDGNSAFAFDLYQALSEADSNLFYSPYSISLALAMTYAGARGETAEQMADTIHFTLPTNRLHPTSVSITTQSVKLCTSLLQSLEGEDAASLSRG